MKSSAAAEKIPHVTRENDVLVFMPRIVPFPLAQVKTKSRLPADAEAGADASGGAEEAHVREERRKRGDASKHVRYRHREPHGNRAVVYHERQQPDARDEADHLAEERKEDGGLRLAD